MKPDFMNESPTDHEKVMRVYEDYLVKKFEKTGECSSCDCLMAIIHLLPEKKETATMAFKKHAKEFNYLDKRDYIGTILQYRRRIEQTIDDGEREAAQICLKEYEDKYQERYGRF